MSNTAMGYPHAYPNSSMNVDISNRVNNPLPYATSDLGFEEQQWNNVSAQNQPQHWQDNSDLDVADINDTSSYQNLFSLLNEIDIGHTQKAIVPGYSDPDAMSKGFNAMTSLASMREDS